MFTFRSTHTIINLDCLLFAVCVVEYHRKRALALAAGGGDDLLSDDDDDSDGEGEAGGGGGNIVSSDDENEDDDEDEVVAGDSDKYCTDYKVLVKADTGGLITSFIHIQYTMVYS